MNYLTVAINGTCSRCQKHFTRQATHKQLNFAHVTFELLLCADCFESLQEWWGGRVDVGDAARQSPDDAQQALDALDFVIEELQERIIEVPDELNELGEELEKERDEQVREREQASRQAISAMKTEES